MISSPPYPEEGRENNGLGADAKASEPALVADATGAASVYAHSGDGQAQWTFAHFGRAISKLSQRFASETAGVAYGMWNPAFCSADARAKTLEFIGEVRAELDHWERRCAQPASEGSL